MALSLAADHLSLYQLTIEEGTKFHTLHARGEFSLPEEDNEEPLLLLVLVTVKTEGRLVALN